MNLVVSAVLNILSEEESNIFGGIKGRVKLFVLKRRLSQNISSEILTRYGNEVYYNDLDRFLMQYNVIESILRNCTNIAVFDYKSRSQLVDYYVKLFVERYPKYKKYYYPIRTLILNYYRVIFLSLNKIDSEPVRVVCNISKELAKELSNQISEEFDATRKELVSLNTKIDSLNAKVDSLIIDENTESPTFSRKNYCSYLAFLFPSYPDNSYINRKLFTNIDENKTVASIDVLLDEKKVLLLGEAGFGKTYESITLLRTAITDIRTVNKIPVLLPLYEYGTLYSDIISGIKHKVGEFCTGDQDKLIRTWLHNGDLILILDGIDDISADSLREKFIIEANDLITKYSNNLFFFTARFNRYHGELGIQRFFTLSKMDEYTIRSELQHAGIAVDIPQNYYELFANPFFLSVGKTVLKKSDNRQLFNRSQLLNALFIELYDGLEQRKGKAGPKALSYSEALSIIGKIAYDSFDLPSYSIMEFDQLVSGLALSNKADAVASFISSGLFIVTDRVIFIHKLLKEYSVAYHLVSNYKLEDNISLYLELVSKSSWKEVLVFVAGIYNDIDLQDKYLDFVMQNNLPLYIECVNSKSDIFKDTIDDNSHDLAMRLLSQIYKTYTYVIPNYFLPISGRFDPQSTDAFLPNSGKCVGLVGCISQNSGWLYYYFDVISSGDREITCITEQDFTLFRDSFEKRALRERRNITTYGVNLKLSGLHGDSGRKIALDVVKARIKELIENKGLIESPYLLCERIACIQRKLKELRDIKELSVMKDMVDARIVEARKKSPDLAGYDYNGVDLFHLRDLLTFLCDHGIKYTDYLLPERDITPDFKTSHWIWDYYSKEQKCKRLSSFFYFHELSYIYMVEHNFPNLCMSFSRYQDVPYQVVIIYDHDSCTKYTDFRSDPTIEYYYIAANTDVIPFPKIIESSGNSAFKGYEKTILEIKNSYLQQGKTAHGYSITQSGFSKTLTSRHTGTNDPLSDFVYESIKKGLEEVFGSFN